MEKTDLELRAEEVAQFEKEVVPYPFDKLPADIDYDTGFDPDFIEDFDYAIDILEYLNTVDRSFSQQSVFDFLCAKFDLEPVADTDITPEEKQAIASDFYLFCRYMFKNLKGFKWVKNYHHQLICSQLERIFLGIEQNPRLIINIPPRFSKTEIVSVYFPCWAMGHYPDSEFIHACYSGSLAVQNSSRIRDILISDAYRQIFEVPLDKHAQAKHDFKTAKGGRVFATSVGGTLTGVGAGKMRKAFGGAILIDDPLKASDGTSSDTVREKANDWFKTSLMSRRNSRDCPIIVVMQRLHANDVSGMLLGHEDDEGVVQPGTGEVYNHLNIPAILTKKQLDDLGFPEDCDSRLEGDVEKDEYPLWPFKFTLEELRNMRDNLPTLTFFGQYQQQPFADGGSIIKSEWFHTFKYDGTNAWDENGNRLEFKYKVIVCDTAMTTKNYSDYSVITTAGVTDQGVYILEVVRGKWEAPKLQEKVTQAFIKHRPRKVYIEYKTSGIGLIQYLKQSVHRVPVIPIPRNGGEGGNDKITRANSAAPYIQAGYVFLPINKPWVAQFIRECEKFPNDTHDDMVDTLIDLVDREVMPRTAKAPDALGLAALPLNKRNNFGEQLLKDIQNSEDSKNTISDIPGWTWDTLLNL